MKTTATTLDRTLYGDLVITGATSPEDRAAYAAATGLIAKAVKCGKIPAVQSAPWGSSGKERGHRIGRGIAHEVYDLAASAVLVCVRETDGSRYGTKTVSKSYFLVRIAGRGVTVMPVPKAVIAKAAKAAGRTVGGVIAVATGKAPVPAPKCAAPRVGYKIVRRDGEGFASVWDGSAWKIGKARIQAASDDHTGGYYFYATLDEAIHQAVDRKTFGDARDYHDLSILECAVSGREFGANKRCASKIKPLREVFAVTSIGA